MENGNVIPEIPDEGSLGNLDSSQNRIRKNLFQFEDVQVRRMRHALDCGELEDAKEQLFMVKGTAEAMRVSGLFTDLELRHLAFTIAETLREIDRASMEKLDREGTAVS